MKKVFRTDVGAQVTGPITDIRRIDGTPIGCQCYRGVGELAGQDECSCTTVDLSDPSGPKFRARSGPTNEDRAQAARDHADAGTSSVKDARDAMVERHTNAWKQTPAAPTKSPARVDKDESEVERARREMTERNQNAWERR